MSTKATTATVMMTVLMGKADGVSSLSTGKGRHTINQ
jgi:hypothetical protein